MCPKVAQGGRRGPSTQATQDLQGERKVDRAGILSRDAVWLPREKRKEGLQASILLHL